MDLTPALNTYIVVGSERERQVLYFSNRPHFSFPMREEKRGDKTILHSTRQAVWTPLLMEVPTRMMPRAFKWVENREISPLQLMVLDKEANVLEEWNIQDAQVVGGERTIGRQAAVPVLRLSVVYSWANRIR